VQPIGDETVTRVYETPLEQYQAESASEPSQWDFFHGDLSVGWAAMDRLIVQRQQACSDLYCLLGGPEQSWECDAQGCTLNGEGAPSVQARLSGEEKLDDGRTAYIVELALVHNWTRTLRIDKQSFALLEIIDRHQDDLIASLQHLERQALSSAQANDLFGAIPHNLEIVQLNQASEGEDRLWIISVSPEPGTELQSRTEFEVVVGYELVSAPEAILQIYLFRPDFESGERLPIIRGTGFVNIQASDEQVTVPFIIHLENEQWLAPGNLALRVTMGVWGGAHYLDVLATEMFVEYQWYKP
jgi:hypothetical protein